MRSMPVPASWRAILQWHDAANVITAWDDRDVFVGDADQRIPRSARRTTTSRASWAAETIGPYLFRIL